MEPVNSSDSSINLNPGSHCWKSHQQLEAVFEGSTVLNYFFGHFLNQLLPHLTCTPKIPKIMKKAQQITTMLPMGFSEDISVSTTSFSPGALLITLKHNK